MKRALGMLTALALIGLMFAGCIGPFDVGDGNGSAARQVVTIEGVGFHCNAFNGNGKVDMVNYPKKGLEEFERIDATTWKLLATQYKCPKCGSNEWITYSNKSGVPDGKNAQLNHPPKPFEKPVVGEIKIEKTVNGFEISAWIKDNTKYTLNQLITGFNLWKVTGDQGDKIGSPEFKPFSGGTIVFSNLSDGWYAVEELLTPAGKTVFEDPGLLYFYVIKGVTYGGADFDYNGLYTIVNGYGSGYVLGYPGLNNSGDIFYIGVKSPAGIEYASFCAHAGSLTFAGDAGHGCAGYMVAAKDLQHEFDAIADYDGFLSAYNFIYNNYGDLNANRAITQVVTWALLGAIDVESPEFDATNLTGAEKAAVRDVVANYDGYVEKGLVADVIYLVCEAHGVSDFGIRNCQPQLLPIYGEKFFINVPKVPEFFDVSFKKDILGGLIPVEAGQFKFELFKDDVLVGTYETAAGGVVTATNLTPGSYVFKELPSLFLGEPIQGEDGNYNLVWKPVYITLFPGGADGLYFELLPNGTIEWKYGLVGEVNNVVSCKHNQVWWDREVYASIPYKTQEFMGGVIITYEDWCHGHLEPTYQAASCSQPGVIWLNCTDCYQATSIYLSDALEHDFVQSDPFYDFIEETNEWYLAGYWYMCSLCGAKVLRTF